MMSRDRAGAGSTTEPTDQLAMRRANLTRTLRYIRANGPRSRAAIAAATGLHKTTVSSLVDELSTRRLVREIGPEHSGVAGRPGRGVALSPDVGAIGIEINVDYLAVHGSDLDRPHRHREAGQLRRHAPRRRALPRRPHRRGPAVPRRTGPPRRDPVGSPWRAGPGRRRPRRRRARAEPRLARRTGRRAPRQRRSHPDLWIGVDNDANLAALAEYTGGVAAGTDDLVYLTGEVGVGGGVILDGRLLRGADGFSGEIGHLPVDPGGDRCGCGRIGCWETKVGLAELVRRATPDAAYGLGDGPVPRPRGTRRARSPAALAAGDRAAVTAVAEIGRWLGHGGAVLVNLFNPRVIVLGGYFAELADQLIPAAQAEPGRGWPWPRPPRRCHFVASHLGFTAAARGGAGVVVERMIEDPTGFPLPGVTTAGGGVSGPHGAAPTGLEVPLPAQAVGVRDPARRTSQASVMWANIASAAPSASCSAMRSSMCRCPRLAASRNARSVLPMYRSMLTTWFCNDRTTARAIRFPDACMMTSWKAASCWWNVSASLTTSSMSSTSASIRSTACGSASRAATFAMSDSRTRRVTTTSSSTARSSSTAMAAARTSSSSRSHIAGGFTTVPLPCRTWTSPFSCRIFTVSRTTVRLTEYVSHSTGSGGNALPGSYVPRTMRPTSSAVSAFARLAGPRTHPGGGEPPTVDCCDAVMCPPPTRRGQVLRVGGESTERRGPAGRPVRRGGGPERPTPPGEGVPLCAHRPARSTVRPIGDGTSRTSKAGRFGTAAAWPHAWSASASGPAAPTAPQHVAERRQSAQVSEQFVLRLTSSVPYTRSGRDARARRGIREAP